MGSSCLIQILFHVFRVMIHFLFFLLWVGRVLGRGALSCVFRGRVGLLRSAVAIKRLDKEDKESAKAFCRELMIASSLHNPNVVPLVGFCIDPEEGLFLVYKYVSGGSLEHHLHGTSFLIFIDSFFMMFSFEILRYSLILAYLFYREEEGCEG